jgi:hypothetical protein
MTELADLARQQQLPRRDEWLKSNRPKPLGWSWRYDRWVQTGDGRSVASRYWCAREGHIVFG